MFAEKDAKILANVCWKRDLCRDVPDRGTVKKPVICVYFQIRGHTTESSSLSSPVSGKAPKVYRKPNAGLYVPIFVRSSYAKLVCRTVYRTAAPQGSVRVCKQAHSAGSCRGVNKSLFLVKSL